MDRGGDRAVSYLDTDPLVDAAYLVDDCHFNADSERRLADLLADHVGDLIPGDRQGSPER
jgi:hypothetical protein